MNLNQSNMKSSLIFWCVTVSSAFMCFAGPINILNLGPEDPIELHLNTGGKETSFNLSNGRTSGFFLLSEESNKIKVGNEEIPDLEVPPTTERSIAILYPTPGGYKWKIVTNHLNDEKWSFRIVNLAGKNVSISRNGELRELASASLTEIQVEGIKQIRIDVPDMIEATYEGRDPHPVTAVLYSEGEELKVIFVKG